MGVLTVEQAVEKSSCKWIKVGRQMVALKPADLYSLNDIIYQHNLLMAFRDPLPPPANPIVAFFRGIIIPDENDIRKLLLPKLAQTFALPFKQSGMRQRHYAQIISKGYEYQQETSKSDDKGNSENDIGMAIGSLMKNLGGTVQSWWDTPQYQLLAMAKSLNPANQPRKQANELDFIEFAGLIGGAELDLFDDDDATVH